MKDDLMVWNWRYAILKYAPEISSYKLLLLTMSCYMNSAGESCFPSVDELEKATSLSRPTVIKYLSMAREDGWIKVIKKPTGHAWNRHEYTAKMPDNVVKLLYRDHKNAVKLTTKRGKPDTKNAVNSVNSTSPYTSPKNSGKFQKKNVDNLYTHTEVLHELHSRKIPYAEMETYFSITKKKRGNLALWKPK